MWVNVAVAPSRSPERIARWVPMAIVAIAVLAMIGAVASRWGASFNIDEPFTATAAAIPWSQLPNVLEHDNTPITYLLLKGWRVVAGDSEVALRALFAIAFGGTVTLCGFVAMRLGGPKAGLLASILAASSSLGLTHAATIRPYALLALESAALLACLATNAPDRGPASWRAKLAFVLIGLTGLLTHIIFVFLLASVGVALAVFARGRQRAVPILLGSSVLIYLLLWWPILRMTWLLPATAWMSEPNARALSRVYLAIWGHQNLITAAIIVVLVATADRTRPGPWRDGFWGAVTITGVLSLALPIAISFYRPVFLLTRTPALALPWLAVAISLLIARLGTDLVIVGLDALLLIGGLHFVVQSQQVGDRSPTKASLQSLVSRMHCGDIIVASGLSYVSVDYYLPRVGAPPCLRAEAFPREVEQHPGWIDERRVDISTMAAEADRLAARVQKGPRLWVLTKTGGVGQPAGEVLLTRLTRLLSRDEQVDLRGNFFDRVTVFSAPAINVPSQPPGRLSAVAGSASAPPILTQLLRLVSSARTRSI